MKIFWDNCVPILKETKKLTKPIVYPDFFDQQFLNEQLIKEMINSAIISKSIDNFRVWLNKRESGNHSNIIMNNPIKPTETLEQWTTRIFQDDRFCIVFSQTEQFSKFASSKIARFLAPLFKQNGIPAGGCSITLFIGNYGFTPTGVHQDQDEKCVFHFNLGPGPKELFIWEPEKFVEITGSKETFMHPEKIINSATRFVLNPFDFLVLPTQYYHIGRTQVFSADLTVVLSDCSNMRMFQEIFKSLQSEILGSLSKQSVENYKVTNTKIKDISLAVPHTETVNQILSDINLEDYYKKMNLHEGLQLKIEDFYFSLLSNGGLNIPLAESSTKDDAYLFKPLKLIEPFKIYYKELDHDKILLYIRGKKVLCKYHKDILNILETINNGQVFTISILNKQYSSYPMALLKDFINCLTAFNSLEVVNAIP